MRSFWGRLPIAVEPLTIALYFSVLPVGLLLHHQEGSIFIAPIFGGAALLFFAYAVVLMISVTRALIESYGSIWAVDGSVHYRAHYAPDRDPASYVSVLDERRQVLGEWPARPPLESARPQRTLARLSRVLPLRPDIAHRRTVDRRPAGRYPGARDRRACGIRPQRRRRLGRGEGRTTFDRIACAAWRNDLSRC